MVSSVFLAIFLITIVIQVITRLLGIAIMWPQDVCIYSFITSVFLGAAAMIYPEKHFAFVSLIDNLKTKKQKTYNHIIIQFVMLFLMVLMVFYGIKITKMFWNYHWINIPQFTRGYTWICIPTAGILGIFYIVEKIIIDIKYLKGGNK